MADGFVVLQSYVDSINLLPADRRWPFFVELFRYRMEGVEPNPQSDLERMALINIFPVIDASVERYNTNKENGAKGGRPRKWIPPEEWLTYYKEHGRKATAEHFGIPEETIKKWLQQVGKKGKNQDIDTDLDIDIDSDKDIDINKSKSINNNKSAGAPVTRKGAPATRLNPGEWVRDGIVYRFTEDGKGVIEVGPA